MGIAEASQENEFWKAVCDVAVRAVRREGLPPFIAYAVTTGDAATAETVGTVTTNQVAVWLDGVAQTTENKQSVVLPYGVAAPAAGQLWMVLNPNFSGPSILLLRVA